MTAKRKLLYATMVSFVLTMISLFAPASQVRADGGGVCHSFADCRFGCEPVTFPEDCWGGFGVPTYCFNGCE